MYCRDRWEERDERGKRKRRGERISGLKCDVYGGEIEMYEEEVKETLGDREKIKNKLLRTESKRGE